MPQQQTMTAGELAALMSRLPADTPVLVMDRDWGHPVPVREINVRPVYPIPRSSDGAYLIEWWTDPEHVRDPYNAVVLNCEPLDSRMRLEVYDEKSATWTTFALAPEHIDTEASAWRWFANNTPADHFKDDTRSRVVRINSPHRQSINVKVGPSSAWGLPKR